MTQTLSVAIVGAGALGSAIGGVLAENGARVTLISGNFAHRDAINRDGLGLTADGMDFRFVTVTAHADCSSVADTVDLAIILIHSAATQDAAHDVRSILRPDSLVFSLQNGLGQEDVLSKILGQEQVLGGKTYAGGIMLAPGKVQATIAGKRTLIGELDGRRSARSTRIANALSAFGVATEVAEDIRTAMWDKLLINVATGALSTVTRMSYGELYAQPEIARIARAAVAEAMAVAKAEGVSLTIAEPDQAWRMASAGLPDNFRTSMLQTILKGRKSEIDFINGAVVARGLKLGIPTPVNATLVACIKGIEASTAFASPIPSKI